ncbi:unnamed protein product [Meganyctiphanes norvegica]|uniref:Uncharacterized protein n=1 Tax=Meganyctiphanes norvegica TaxID=48144 RepID=A0AAV2RLU6_MEGNR
MKFVIVLCLFGLAMGAPRPQEEEAVVLPDEVVEEAPVEETAPPPPPAEEEAPLPIQTIDATPVQAVINTKAEGEPVVVLIQKTSPVIGAVFNHELQLDNGIAETRSGSEGPAGTSVMKGSFTIPLGNGEVATFNWVADENGYRVESPFLPTEPPAPAHVAEQLRVAAEQRAAGTTFE